MSGPTDDDVIRRVHEMRQSADVPQRIAGVIWDDVTDRRGWRHEADNFDPDIKMEILDTWTRLITEAFP